MATVILVRHGRSTANATGVLAGRLPGVQLDDAGRAQAARSASGSRRAPCGRGVQPARALPADRTGDHRRQACSAPRERRRQLSECDYGDWQGRPLKDLAKETLWKIVQSQPSAATFPGGESMRAMQDRAVEAVRRHDARSRQEHGAGAVWVAVSHGDVIKAILADALGTHLDLFQRIHVDPASVSVVRLHRGPALRPRHQHPRRRPGLAHARRTRRRQAATVGGCPGRAAEPARQRLGTAS